MMLFIAFETVLFAVGVLFFIIGVTGLLAYSFNTNYKASTGVAYLLMGIAIITAAMMLGNAYSGYFKLIQW